MQTLGGTTGAELRTFTTRQLWQHLQHFYKETNNHQWVLFSESDQTSGRVFSWTKHQPVFWNYPALCIVRISCAGGHWRKIPCAQWMWPQSWRKWWDCCHPVTVHMIDDSDEELTKRSDGKLMETEEHKWGFLKAGFHYVKQNKPGWKCLNLKFQSAVLN